MAGEWKPIPPSLGLIPLPIIPLPNPDGIPRAFRRSAGFPACGFWGLSSPQYLKHGTRMSREPADRNVCATAKQLRESARSKSGLNPRLTVTRVGGPRSFGCGFSARRRAFPWRVSPTGRFRFRPPSRSFQPPSRPRLAPSSRGLKIPSGVMMPVISSGGVTSNPGLRAPLVGLATRTYVRRDLRFEI
jgi:hypothetical protein